MAAKKYNLVFYLALVIALGATYGVYRVMESTRLANQVTTRPVVVASRNIPQGALVNDALRVENWPEPIVPDSAIGDPALLTGRVSRIPIFAGEVLVPGRLAPEGVGPGLEAKIPLGKRAMGMRVDAVSGMSGMIQPESKVDVLLLLDANIGGTSQRTAKLFMPNMRVLAMGTEVHRNEKGEPIPTAVATLEVSPAEAERLAVATSQGRIQLVLRGFSDNDSARTRGATTTDVVNSLRDIVPSPPRSGRTAAPLPKNEAPRVVEPPAPVTPAPISTVQKPETLKIPVYRGAKRSEERFSKDSVRRDTIKP